MSNLFDEVRAGRLDVSTLSGVEYQQLVFERLLGNLFTDPRVLSVENHAQGPVDYVVHEPSTGGMLGKARKHYFECKNYGRALELDNVAKIMVVAIAEQPDSVHVVSRTRLQPQISTYASRLFDIGDDGSPIFRSIAFRHWQTDHLLNLNATAIGSSPPAIAEESLPARKPSWWITECSAYTETEVASSAASSRQVPLRWGCLLLLTLELPQDRTGDVALAGLPEGSWTEVGSASSDPSLTARHTFLIDTSQLAPQDGYRVSARFAWGAMQAGMPLVELHLEGGGAVLPELRPRATKDLSTKLGPTGHHRLALIDGEAGVGKTHFIEKVAEGLRGRFGFDVTSFTVTDEHQETLLTALLNACLTPPIHQDNFQEVAAAVQRALLSKEIDSRALEANVGLLARIATRMGPRMIVLRDCHLLKDQVANQLWALIVAFDDAGWGGARLALEYRQPDAAANVAFQALVTRVKLKIRKVLVAKTLLPLTSGEFGTAAEQLFQHITPEITECLMQRTGGLPLFIDSYVQRLLDLGFVGSRPDRSRGLTILQPAQVLADVVPAGGAAILEQRVNTCLSNAFSNDPSVTIQLGLIALCESAAAQSWVRRALSLSPQAVGALQLALDQAGLAQGRPDGQVVFRHDLLRTAVVSVALACDGFAASARSTAQRLLQDADAQDLGIRRLRARIFAAIGDRIALEVELRLGAQAAREGNDYGHLVAFLSQLLELLPGSPTEERLDVMSGLAWAAWVSDSLLVARQRYLQLADEAQRSASVAFSIAEAVATDAYRRAIGIDLELMEPLAFLTNALAVLKRRQTPVTFNSIMNRLVLFCARFGYPVIGCKLSALSFNYLGDGLRANEGAVICSELGALHAPFEPKAALSLFRQGLDLARDDCQRTYNELDVLALETLHLGRELDEGLFDNVWRLSSAGRFSEVLTRASLLRGSLCLRAGDLAGARHWITRTLTMVNLYHLKEFELPALNDQVILSLLEGNEPLAKRQLAAFVAEFEPLVDQRDGMTQLVSRVMDACLAASQKLTIEPSPLVPPERMPHHCGVFFELWRNVLAIAPALGMPELTQKYSEQPEWLWSATPPTWGHRQVQYGDLTLAVGAY